MKFAKKNNQKLLKTFLILTLFLGLGFVFFQTKGWIKLMNQGKMIGDNIFYSYGAYGSDFVILKDGQEIDYDGYHYLMDGKELSEEEVQSMKDFAHEIAGDRRREVVDDYHVEDYGAPFTIKRLAKDTIAEAILDFKDKKVYANGKALTPGEQKDLFRFAFGIYRDMPYFIIKGTYGKDFYLLLNNERLDFENQKLYYPERELTESEVKAIDKTVYQSGKNYEIKNGDILEEGTKIDPKGFESYLDLNDGIQVHVKDGKWTQMKQELNDAQYSEFYQTSNVASSYIWVFTVMHVLHMIIGFIILLIVLTRSFKGCYNQNNQLGIKIGGIIWHFLGALWVTLFLLLQYFH